MRAIVLRATLRDVAAQAGVHQSTVSLALRGSPRIPASTRRRIESVAQALNYRADPLVSALMRSRRRRTGTDTVTLAYVTNHPTRFGWRSGPAARPDCFAGAQTEATRRGFKLEHFWFREPGIAPQRFCEILRNRGIHGVLLGRLPPGQASWEFEYERFSCVGLGLTPSQPALARVAEDHFDAASQAMEQCLARGYRRVGLAFAGAGDCPAVAARWIGAHRAQQLRWPEADRLPPYLEPQPGARSFARWFDEQRPDAVIATQALPVLRWLEGLGRGVPSEVGLVDLDAGGPHEFSGVRHDAARVGARAVETLVDLLQRHATGASADTREQVLLPGRWCEGTTLPPARERAGKFVRFD